MIWTYCRAVNGVVIYPFDLSELTKEGLSIGVNADPRTLAKFNVYHVHIEQEPAFEVGKVWDKNDLPVLTGGFWQITWVQRDQTPDELLAERGVMQVERLTGRLVLGEAVCGQLDLVAKDPNTPFAMRETIAGAMIWHRTSQSMDELGYLLGFTEAQKDGLFRAGMAMLV